MFFLLSLFKNYLFRACVKDFVFFTFLMLRFILVHIFGPRKDHSSCPIFYFHWGRSSTICDLVLYLLYEGLNMTLIYGGTSSFLYLKTVVAMQDSTLSETESQFISLKWAAPMLDRGGKSKKRRMHIFFSCLELRLFRFLLSGGRFSWS